MRIQEVLPGRFVVNCKLSRRDMEHETLELLRKHFRDDEILRVQEELCSVLIGRVSVTSHQIALPVSKRI